jgi:DNA-binding transcriptional ArsR family regulator
MLHARLFAQLSDMIVYSKFHLPGANHDLAGVTRCGIFNQSVDLGHLAPHPSVMTHPLDATFAALADPTRRAILAMLLEDDMAVTDVAAPFEMSLAAISKHLGILAEAGLISRERRGRVIWCKLEPDALRAASVWMQGFGQFDPVDLDAFEKYLETELRDDPAEDATEAEP